ncbi:MAG: hypothetical protein FJZ92_14475 [Chloroflexi bacterium]|nr:hypothetical protein [Chloroflexota bacterium]MBM4245825.1 hypothetical protein [Deltaproteobacteria bacterium]
MTVGGGQGDASWAAGARLYSGRVDPSWSVAAARARVVIEVFRALPPSARVHPAGGGVGYRGCWLRAPDGTSWVAANGLAALRSPAHDEVREDAQRAFEDAILATAPDGVLPSGVRAGARRSPPRA